MRPRIARLWLPLLAASLLAGCVRETARLPVDWNNHVAVLREHANWTLQGKIGARAADGGGSALLSWTQDHDRYRLVLSGALGLGRLVLDGDPDGVRWTGRDGRLRTHPDPAALVRELWGWELPVESLAWWVRGLPDPAHELRDPRFENGLATHFGQAGWTIEASDYHAVDGVDLPSRLRLQGQGAIVTVSISRWSLGPP